MDFHTVVQQELSPLSTWTTVCLVQKQCSVQMCMSSSIERRGNPWLQNRTRLQRDRGSILDSTKIHQEHAKYLLVKSVKLKVLWWVTEQ